MMRTFPVILVIALLFACSKAPESLPHPEAPPSTLKEGQYSKELEEIKKNLNGDIKIKLKKDGKGDFYSWEISGKDAVDVLKANDILSRKLDRQKPSVP
jgi:hypothetical protein